MFCFERPNASQISEQSTNGITYCTWYEISSQDMLKTGRQTNAGTGYL